MSQEHLRPFVTDKSDAATAANKMCFGEENQAPEEDAKPLKWKMRFFIESSARTPEPKDPRFTKGAGHPQFDK